MEAFKPGTGAKRKSWNKWHWTHEEDNLLSKLVKTHGPGNWDYIARHLQRRTGKSCRLRWINQLNPEVDKTPFSEEEQQRLLQLQREYGNRWATISSFLPGRTDNQVKNQYHVLVGTRYKKSLGPYSITNPHDAFERQSMFLSRYGSISMVPVASQFVNAPYGGYSYFVLAPCFTAMPQSFDSANLAKNIYPHQRISHGDAMTYSDANSAANYQFIDFMGVGSSD